MKVIVLGNFTPRKCGIATFTENLVKSIQHAAQLDSVNIDIEVVAMNDKAMEYKYPSIVKHVIRDDRLSEYYKAAEWINHSGADLCLLQHEFGIFGGKSGTFLLALLQNLRIPLAATFHTVLERPSFHEKGIISKIGRIASAIVVMNPKAIGFLNEVNGVPFSKASIIEHGVPDFSKTDHLNHNKFGLKGKRKVLLTFGLLGRSKGLETAIRSLPAVVAKHPDILYVILGKTHPNIVKNSGEEYREYLIGLIKKLQIEDNVLFINEYVSEIELMEYLLSADIYLTPYLNKAQITSGTLSYAIGAGAAVISTPYWHAEVALADGRGRLFEFRRSDQLANEINTMLDNPAQMNEMRDKAKKFGVDLAWPEIGKRYIRMFKEVINAKDKNIENGIFSPPPFSLDHIFRLTDQTSIVQHAKFHIPNHKRGYCMDDNSRALLVSMMVWRENQDPTMLRLAEIYLSFMFQMQNDDGWFKNYMASNKTTFEEKGSEDAFGRSIWALGFLIRNAPNDAMFGLANNMFYRAADNFGYLGYTRGIANTLIGLYHYSRRYPDNEHILAHINDMATQMVYRLEKHSSDGWIWFEPSLTYDNGILPYSLMLAGKVLENREMINKALTAVDFLRSICFAGNHLTFVGNANGMMKGEKMPQFAQQPIDAAAKVLMFEMAFRLTNKPEYLESAINTFKWFFGFNDLGLPLYDDETHGCCDGLEEDGVNRNQGAESIITYLMAFLTINRYF